MAKQETKEVTVKKSTPPPVVYQTGPSVVDSDDIIVPKLLLAQGLSKSVASGEAKMGDITNSLSGAVIGGNKAPINFIPLTLKKYWRQFEVVNGKKTYRGTKPFVKGQAQELKEMRAASSGQGQTQWEFDLCIDVYGFTESDVQDPIALPSVVSFTRTSYKAGQKVNSHFASLEAADPMPLPYHTYMLEIGCEKIQNDKGIFYTFDTKNKGQKTPEKYMSKISKWSKILNDTSRRVVADEAEDVAAETATTVDDSRF